MTIHTTLDELIEQEIVPSLGEFAASFDVDGFVAELRARDLIRWTGRGYELVADEDEYWTSLADFDQD